MEWTVVIAGVAAIGWVNWYFFLAGRSASAIFRPPSENKEER